MISEPTMFDVCGDLKLRKPECCMKKIDLKEHLKYISPEEVAKDFRSPRERAAIAAVFKWLSLNGLCAWRLKNGQYSTKAMSKTVRRDGPHEGVLLDTGALRRAEKVLFPSKLVKPGS